MKDALRMWKYTKMVVLTALSAAIYAAVLIPFKAIPLIPGFTEIRPANLFPVLLGLLFGPAGAWGSAIGNLIGDFFGTFGIGSLFGFVGNFLYAYIPYKIWGRYGILPEDDKTPTINSAKKFVEFEIATVVASTACAIVIAWGLDVLKMVPFAALSTIITVNNAIISAVLGPVVLVLLYPRIKKWGLLWSDILAPEDIPVPKLPKVYSSLVLIGAIGGLVVGLIISLGFANQAAFAAGFAAGGAGSIGVGLGILPFLAAMFYGAFKL
ncbi:MAG: energy-coupling factor transport system substrate-specific component [Petroclostridium sp.]|jgi:energy-coupling factor transport system substrate-specific component|uniref:QueT transporter family protein n=1 Tax=Petroclostridium xylanilyticum TaxID=1792311 RepID=UPI000B993B5A|nr:QueT transporter family protein [Petroclostridium xylanilyticum]MBZ4645472.1 hypothetical protein [Clostridia bacterium]MDK2811032.1 energy-coupling factor transport system substrate-specific component [Petroclostridium sp.]